MADTLKAEEQLIQKHKKERKEVQAQIQTLKKSVCKGDKKRKKELGEEIARLEAELDKRQNEELAQFRLSKITLIEETNNLDEAELVDSANTESNNDDHTTKLAHGQRISKAQKRRDKKSTAERERNQRIIEQEVENIHGKRNVEIQAINKTLRERNLVIQEIPSDGNCLYNALAHQLKTIGETPLSFQELRTKTAAYLRENVNDFLPFLSNPDSDEIISLEQYEKYCKDVAETSAWGGAIELQVLSHVLKCPIEVIQASGAPYVIGDEYNIERKLVITYHRHMYGLGAHYNSVASGAKGKDAEETNEQEKDEDDRPSS